MLRNDDGATFIEAAIVLPVMLLLILGGLDLGLGMVVATRLNFATESAAACGAVAACPDPAAFASSQSGIPAGAFSVSQSPDHTMETVSASYGYRFMFLPWTITLQSTASFPVLPPPTTPPPTKS
jgi:hypothetical protein